MGKIKIINEGHTTKLTFIDRLERGECFILAHEEYHPSADIYMKINFFHYNLQYNCISLSGSNFLNIDPSTKLIKVNPTLTYIKE
jgi:hypothetical protein